MPAPKFVISEDQLEAIRHTVRNLPVGTHEAQAFDQCLAQPLRLAFREVWRQERAQVGPTNPREENERLKKELAELKAKFSRDPQGSADPAEAAALATEDDATR